VNYYVNPYFVGGPRDGEVAGICPAAELRAKIDHDSGRGRYVYLERREPGYLSDPVDALVMREFAVYVWEPLSCLS
jgi:hypothetical protein